MGFLSFSPARISVPRIIADMQKQEKYTLEVRKRESSTALLQILQSACMKKKGLTPSFIYLLNCFHPCHEHPSSSRLGYDQTLHSPEDHWRYAEMGEIYTSDTAERKLYRTASNPAISMHERKCFTPSFNILLSVCFHPCLCHEFQSSR